jgi:hypothetical protein
MSNTTWTEMREPLEGARFGSAENPVVLLIYSVERPQTLRD